MLHDDQGPPPALASCDPYAPISYHRHLHRHRCLPPALMPHSRHPPATSGRTTSRVASCSSSSTGKAERTAGRREAALQASSGSA